MTTHRRLRYAVLVLAFALGLTLMALGFTRIGDWAVCLGGLLGGAVAGHVMAMLLPPIDDFPRQSTAPSERQPRKASGAFVLGNTPLDPIVCQWSHLYALRVHEGERSWIHMQIAYDAPAARAASLTGTMSNADPKGDVLTYKVETRQIGNRLLLLIKPVVGTESIGVFVFPTFFDLLESPQAGIAALYTFEKKHRCLPVFLSKVPLMDFVKAGRMDDAHVQAMDELWATASAGFVESLSVQHGRERGT